MLKKDGISLILYINKKDRTLIGCKFLLHKNDMLDVNGFDERYELPSIGEDTDTEYRLVLNGVKTRSLNNIAVQYHLYHEEQLRSQKNLEIKAFKYQLYTIWH